MGINYIKGDLFTTDRQVIAHGCNTKGVFSAGVAAQISHFFPEVKQAYVHKYKAGNVKLGEIQIVGIDCKEYKNLLYIANLFTQNSYGRTGVHISYQACYLAFKSLIDFCESANLDISMPKIGCGLGGGRWDKVEDQLIEALNNRSVEIDVYYQ